MFTPALSPEHQLRWKSAGTLILLHLLTLGNGPEPISPFLVYLLLTGALLTGEQNICHRDALIGLGPIYQLYPEAADALRPWMVLKETDRLSGLASGEANHALFQIQSILNRCEYQVSPAVRCSMAAITNRLKLNTVRPNRNKEDHER